MSNKLKYNFRYQPEIFDQIRTSEKYQSWSNKNFNSLSNGNLLQKVLNKNGVYNRKLLLEITTLLLVMENKYDQKCDIVRYLKVMNSLKHQQLVQTNTILERVRNTEEIESGELDRLKRENANARQLIKVLREEINKRREDDNKHENNDDIECSICLFGFENEEEVIKHEGRCIALFHQECILQWIKTRQNDSRLFDCPNCRTDVSNYLLFKYQKNDNKEEEGEIIRETPKCEKCNIDMVLKKSKRGTSFWGCSNFSDKQIKCRFTKSVV